MMRLNDIELTKAINQLKQDLGSKSLINALSMLIKHLPTYNKIVKSHISQLQNVLALDNHFNQNLNSINLPETVTQLISIFEQLEDNDLEKLEQLYNAAVNWQKQASEELAKDEVSATV